jgi:uncharacterized damage-inducible protein DinB
MPETPVFPPLDITPTWARFNDELIRLVDYIPDDKLNWSPKPELWNFRGILLHIAATRYGWMSVDRPDGEQLARAVWETLRSKADIQGAYRRTWECLVPFLRDEAKLAATYDDGGQKVSGHWIAFHLLEHDIHHRADIFHYLSLLDIKTPDVGTP